MILDIKVTVGSVRLWIKVWLRQKERWEKNKWKQEKIGKIGTKERRKNERGKGRGEKRGRERKKCNSSSTLLLTPSSLT